MIKVGRILAAIRKDKGFTQGSLIKQVKQYCSEGQIRDTEAGRTAYIAPVVLHNWLEFLELSEPECEFLIQENVRCLIRSELEAIKAFKVKPHLLAPIADLGAMITRGKLIDTTTVAAEINKHILPHLYIRPPYIDSVITRINKEQ